MFKCTESRFRLRPYSAAGAEDMALELHHGPNLVGVLQLGPMDHNNPQHQKFAIKSIVKNYPSALTGRGDPDQYFIRGDLHPQVCAIPGVPVATAT
jgi:hypothetical protein